MSEIETTWPVVVLHLTSNSSKDDGTLSSSQVATTDRPVGQGPDIHSTSVAAREKDRENR